MTAETSALHEQVTRAYEEWRDDIYRYLLTLNLPPQQAQDAVQEVFLRLYVALRKDEESIRDRRAWVFRVAHNYAMNVRSREAPLRQLEPEFEAALADGARGLEGGLIEQQKLQRVHRAIQTLSPQQRQCLHLRAEGLRYQEIADSIGISVSTVSEFLRRALTRLRKAVHE